VRKSTRKVTQYDMREQVFLARRHRRAMLVATGDELFGTTRWREKMGIPEAIGGAPLVVDAFVKRAM
jgi:hypothetical protein